MISLFSLSLSLFLPLFAQLFVKSICCTYSILVFCVQIIIDVSICILRIGYDFENSMPIEYSELVNLLNICIACTSCNCCCCLNAPPRIVYWLGNYQSGTIISGFISAFVQVQSSSSSYTHTPDHRIRFLIKHHLHGRTAAYRCDWGVDYCGFARLSHALNPRWMYLTYTYVHTAHTQTSTLNHTLTVFASSSTRYKTSLTGSSLVG